KISRHFPNWSEIIIFTITVRCKRIGQAHKRVFQYDNGKVVCCTATIEVDMHCVQSGFYWPRNRIRARRTAQRRMLIPCYSTLVSCWQSKRLTLKYGVDFIDVPKNISERHGV